MNRKRLFFIAAIAWGNIGLFYFFYIIKFETVLVGVFRELTLIPSFLAGVISLLLLILSLFKKTN